MKKLKTNTSYLWKLLKVESKENKMLNEQEKQAFLNGAYGVTQSGDKCRLVFDTKTDRDNPYLVVGTKGGSWSSWWTTRKLASCTNMMVGTLGVSHTGNHFRHHWRNDSYRTLVRFFYFYQNRRNSNVKIFYILVMFFYLST